MSFFEVLERQRRCLAGLDSLHQPVKTIKMQNGKSKKTDRCKTCQPGNFESDDWPCETRKLLNELKVGESGRVG